MSKFAEDQLKKYGWNKGDGIGKNNQGIVNPIKASFKFDNTGVGYDIADEFTTNWWEHLFNHTAKKIDASNGLKRKETNDEEKSKSFLNKKSLFYARFQKASLLVDGQTVKVESEEKKEPIKKEEKEENTYDKKGKKIVSDEELFKLCEGRTAHKGARHGIKMNGKLARLEEQETNFYQSTQMKNDSNKRTLENEINYIEDTNIDDTELTHKKKKKKKKNKE